MKTRRPAGSTSSHLISAGFCARHTRKARSATGHCFVPFVPSWFKTPTASHLESAYQRTVPHEHRQEPWRVGVGLALDEAADAPQAEAGRVDRVRQQGVEPAVVLDVVAAARVEPPPRRRLALLAGGEAG